MKRPFYVHFPRNLFGEHLNVLPFEIRSVFEVNKTIREIKDLKEAQEICKQMNDRHEAEMAAIYI